MNRQKPYDLIIIGAGAAGLMCGLRAGQRGKRVLILDHADKIGSKILISGGGRCNFTNLGVAPDRYISGNKHFCISALKSFTQHDFIKMIEAHDIAYHEKTLGQQFCDEKASQITEMLLASCKKAKVTINLNQHIKSVRHDELYSIKTQSKIFEGSNLVIATGAPSIPKMGATGFAYQIAEQFGVAITKTKPGLVPLIFEGEILSFCKSLSGISLEVIASHQKTSFREKMLFTHRGLSGPAILQISSYWDEGNELMLNLLPDIKAAELLISQKDKRPKAALKTILGEHMPQRLATALCETHKIETPLGETSNKKLQAFGESLNNWRITPSGTEGFDKAEVTVGGISTKALSSKTMEVQNTPGLYFVGEAVDVTGWLGGYNLQWAWSSGYAAGNHIE